MKQKLFNQEPVFVWATLAIPFAGSVLHGWLWVEGAPREIIQTGPTGIEIRNVEEGSPEAR